MVWRTPRAVPSLGTASAHTRGRRTAIRRSVTSRPTRTHGSRRRSPTRALFAASQVSANGTHARTSLASSQACAQSRMWPIRLSEKNRTKRARGHTLPKRRCCVAVLRWQLFICHQPLHCLRCPARAVPCLCLALPCPCCPGLARPAFLPFPALPCPALPYARSTQVTVSHLYRHKSKHDRTGITGIQGP